jgi:hypothetical protein
MGFFTVNSHSVYHGVLAVCGLSLVTQDGSLSEHIFIWFFKNERIK